VELARLQDLLYRILTAPSGAAEGLANEKDALGRDGLDGLIRGDDRLSAQDRLEIYANAYFYRVLDVLREDFPATLAVLGDDQFHNLITGYLIDHPPSEPSIQHAGRYLPEFLRGHPLSESRPFLADLATLERTLLEVFHAMEAPPLTAADLGAIDPAEWPAIEMATHPASCILDLEWHVEAAVRAIENDQPPQLPLRGSLTLLVWRHNSSVQYRELERGESAALAIAKDGTTFAAICEAVAQQSGSADPAQMISRLLGQWLSAGLLIRGAP
jgi:hypothetical protein